MVDLLGYLGNVYGKKWLCRSLYAATLRYLAKECSLVP